MLTNSSGVTLRPRGTNSLEHRLHLNAKGGFIEHLQPTVRIVGVQASNAPAYSLSWRKGDVITTETCATIADGLATRTPVLENVRAIRELVDDVRLVSEGQLFGAIRHLLNEKVLAEPAGAATTAAWLAQPANIGNVALVVSGGNIAENVMREVSEG